jgi:hypothetical protein
MIKKHILKDVGVLFIVTIMVFSTVVVNGNNVNTSHVESTISYNDLNTRHVSDSFDRATIFNNPPNKPSQPSGPTEGDVGVEYTYSSSAIDPEDGNVYLWWDWDDGTNSGWLGPYSSGESASASHTWSESELYCIKVKAKNDIGNESVWSDELCVTISGGGNNPPNKPSKPSGPINGEPGVEYTYTTSTTDPDGDMVRYGWEWTRDDTVESWTGYYNSGEICSINHVFDEPGIYYLKVLAQDSGGAFSEFSRTLTIVISTATESCVKIEKKVWDPHANQWVEEIDTFVNEKVDFQITFTNCGLFTWIQYPTIIDTLSPCFEYIDGSASEPPISTTGGIIEWSFYQSFEPGYGDTITFSAYVICEGYNTNNVEISVKDEYGTDLYDTDSASVYAIYQYTTSKLWCNTTKLEWLNIDNIPSDTDMWGMLYYIWDPSQTVTKNFIIKNIGPPGTTLNWKIMYCPDWYDDPFGNILQNINDDGWDIWPLSGSLGGGQQEVIYVTVVAREVWRNNRFTGQVGINNIDNPNDYWILDALLTTEGKLDIIKPEKPLLWPLPYILPMKVEIEIEDMDGIQYTQFIVEIDNQKYYFQNNLYGLTTPILWSFVVTHTDMISKGAPPPVGSRYYNVEIQAKSVDILGNELYTNTIYFPYWWSPI